MTPSKDVSGSSLASSSLYQKDHKQHENHKEKRTQWTEYERRWQGYCSRTVRQKLASRKHDRQQELQHKKLLSSSSST